MPFDYEGNQMSHREKIVRGTIAAGAVVVVGSLLVVPHDEASQRMVALMLFMSGVAAASVAVSVLLLGRAMTPVEQAYRLGYTTGYEDGHKSEKPLVIDFTTELRRRAAADKN